MIARLLSVPDNYRLQYGLQKHDVIDVQSISTDKHPLLGSMGGSIYDCYIPRCKITLQFMESEFELLTPESKL